MATTINWTDVSPALPINFEYNSFNETQQDGSVETNMDTGPSKKRRRFTSVTEAYGGSMTMDSSQKAAFKTFFQSILKQGSLTFNFPNPVSTGTIEVRLIGTPKYKALENSYWSIMFTVEEQP